MTDRQWCFLLLALTAVLGGIEFYGSYATNSNSIWGDAVHIISDGLPFVGVLFLLKKLYLEEQEGMIEFGIRLFNQAFVGTNGVYLCVASVLRYFDPQPIDALVVIYAAVGFVGNIMQAYIAHRLQSVYSHAGTHRSQMLHLFSDIGTSGLVLVVAGLIAFTGVSVLDAALGLILGLVMTAIALFNPHDHAHEHAHQH